MLLLTVIPNSKNSPAGIKIKISLCESRACMCGYVVIHALRDKRVVLTCSAWYTARIFLPRKTRMQKKKFPKTKCDYRLLKECWWNGHSSSLFSVHMYQEVAKTVFLGS
jgi:hypothetical protein